MSEPITEQWLRAAGFKRESGAEWKDHWVLWMGGAVADKTAYSSEDLGVEVAPCLGGDGRWFCWVRADYCGRYSRFVHVRHLRKAADLAGLIAALTGFPFDPANSMYGGYHKPETAARLREDYARRLEVRLAREWAERVLRETGQDPDDRDKVRP